MRRLLQARGLGKVDGLSIRLKAGLDKGEIPQRVDWLATVDPLVLLAQNGLGPLLNLAWHAIRLELLLAAGQKLLDLLVGRADLDRPAHLDRHDCVQAGERPGPGKPSGELWLREREGDGAGRDRLAETLRHVAGLREVLAMRVDRAGWR